MPKSGSALLTASFTASISVSLSAFLTPATPRAGLPAGPCDYLVVSDSLLAPQARRLADLRSGSTPAVAARPCVAVMGDIERAYPPAGRRWTALRDYLRARSDADGEILRHVVLFGSADYAEASERNRVPIFRQEIGTRDPDEDHPLFDTLISDDAFSSFFDSLAYSGAIHPRFAVGRIPAATIAQAEIYVDKVEAYEKAFPYGPEAFTYGYVSDDDLSPNSAGGVEPIGTLDEQHLELWDALPVKPFVRRVLSIEFPADAAGRKPLARDSVIGLFNSGPARVYYIGHGSPARLADEHIFEVPDDLSRFAPKRLQPLVTMLACGTVPIANEGANFGAELLFHPDGAIAFLGMSIPAYPYPNLLFGKAFDAEALRAATFGEAVAAVKRAFGSPANGSVQDQDLAAFLFLGDPALSLHLPAFDLEPAAGSGPGRLSLADAGAEGDSVYVQMVRIDSVPWNGVIHPANVYQRDRLYPRESVLAEIRARLGPGGTADIALPPVADPVARAVKVMTWNRAGMRYGHFPLDPAAGIARRPARNGPNPSAVRMQVRGNQVWLERGGRFYGLDGRVRNPGGLPSRPH